MDPNANLAEQNVQLLHGPDPDRLEDLRRALLVWLRRGGFQPDWTKYPVAAEAFTEWRWRYS